MGEIPTKVFIADGFLFSGCWGFGAPHIVFFVVVIGANYFLSVVTHFDRLSDHTSTGSVCEKNRLSNVAEGVSAIERRNARELLS